MFKELNPYEPTCVQVPMSWYWDRVVWTQAAFGLQFLILFTYCLLTVSSDKSLARVIIETVPVIHYAVVSIAGFAFFIVCASTITKSDWPHHLRCWLIGIDVFVLAVLLLVAQGFGPL